MIKVKGIDSIYLRLDFLNIATYEDCYNEWSGKNEQFLVARVQFSISTVITFVVF